MCRQGIPIPSPWGGRWPAGRMRGIMKSNRTHLAQELRKNQTKEEARLWYQFLRKYPQQFRRQHPIGTYIVDFYCAKAKIVVELDGSQHYESDGISHDIERTAYLEALGLKVLRFSNSDVNIKFPNVCAAIDLAVKERMREGSPLIRPLSGAPSPQGEGIGAAEGR